MRNHLESLIPFSTACCNSTSIHWRHWQVWLPIPRRRKHCFCCLLLEGCFHLSLAFLSCKQDPY